MNKLIPIKGGFVGDYECPSSGEEQNTSDMATVKTEGEKPVRYKIDFSKMINHINQEKK